MSIRGHVTAAALCACVVAGTPLAAKDEDKVDLKVGDKAPTFKATCDTGKEWKSSDHVGKKFLVVYFFPAAFTGG
jgi:peroxiredoxin Q/BCP